MQRNVWGVIAGAALCYFGFLALAFGLAQLWPAYAVHGRTYLQQRLFTFPAPMAVCTLLLWATAAFSAGFATMKITQTWRAVQALAALIVAYAAAVHLILEWPRFPWWYNVTVVLQMGPAVLLGARSARLQ
jgi:hypothetical protein